MARMLTASAARSDLSRNNLEGDVSATALANLTRLTSLSVVCEACCGQVLQRYLTSVAALRSLGKNNLAIRDLDWLAPLKQLASLCVSIGSQPACAASVLVVCGLLTTWLCTSDLGLNQLGGTVPESMGRLASLAKL
nr:hypothetical protein HK105_000376 [Polyrhizophydium stewartii]